MFMLLTCLFYQLLGLEITRLKLFLKVVSSQIKDMKVYVQLSPWLFHVDTLSY